MAPRTHWSGVGSVTHCSVRAWKILAPRTQLGGGNLARRRPKRLRQARWLKKSWRPPRLGARRSPKVAGRSRRVVVPQVLMCYTLLENVRSLWWLTCLRYRKTGVGAGEYFPMLLGDPTAPSLLAATRNARHLFDNVAALMAARRVAKEAPQKVAKNTTQGR